MSVRLPRRHRCSQIPPAEACVLPRVAGLQRSKRAAAQPIESCHVERSETSLTIGLANRSQEISEILRSAQNDKRNAPQWRKCRIPVKSIAMLRSFAAAI